MERDTKCQFTFGQRTEYPACWVQRTHVGSVTCVVSLHQPSCSGVMCLLCKCFVQHHRSVNVCVKVSSVLTCICTNHCQAKLNRDKAPTNRCSNASCSYPAAFCSWSSCGPPQHHLVPGSCTHQNPKTERKQLYVGKFHSQKCLTQPYTHRLHDFCDDPHVDCLVGATERANTLF